MKKIFFLLCFPTLLFSQKVIKHDKIPTNAIKVDIDKWQGKVINFDSLYSGEDFIVIPIGETKPFKKNSNIERYSGSNSRIASLAYMGKKGKTKKVISFIEGLNIGETDSRKKYNQFIVKENYSFYGSIFKGSTVFMETDFLKGFSANNTKFLGATSFFGSIFNTEAAFDNSYFKEVKIEWLKGREKLFDGRGGYNDTLSTVIFSLCDFHGLSMHNAIFDSSVDFIESIFRNGGVDFSGCKFNKNVCFSQSTFLGMPNFTETFFGGEVDFRDVIFQNTLEYYQKPLFKKTVFNGVSSWERAVLSDTTDFSTATFKQIPNFNKTQLPIYLNLSSLNLKDLNAPIRFDLAVTDSLQKRWGEGQKCRVLLNTFSDINKIVLDASKFIIVFEDNMKYDDKIGVFEQVIKKCKEIGFGESTKGFDIELQKLQLRHGYPIIGNFLIWLNDYWWNFGYEKSKIFRNTGIAFLLSFLIFFFQLSDYSRVYFPSQMGMTNETASRLPLFSWMRFRVSLFYTALIFFTWKMEHGEVNYRNYPMKTLIIYTVFTVGIIHLAYLAGAVISR